MEKQKEENAKLNALKKEHEDLMRAMNSLESEKLLLEEVTSQANEYIRLINAVIPVS